MAYMAFPGSEKMTGTSRLIASAAIGGLVLGTPAVAGAQGASRSSIQPVARVASFPAGSIQGVVQDEKNDPVAGAVVTAVGANTTIAVTDQNGRFELHTLPPGPYLVRAHLTGFVTAPAQIIQVRSSARAASSIALRHAGVSTPVLAAGLGPAPDPTPVTAPEAADPVDSESAATGETAWRIRHTRRSILKDATLPVDLLAGADEPGVDGFAPVD